MIAEPAATECLDDWEFCRHVDLGWSWRNVNETGITESRSHFDTFADAMEDAVKHGLQPGISRIVSVTPDRRFHAR
jgi:hypothetical protein